MSESAAADLSWEDQSERNFIGGAWRFTREGYSFDIYDPADSTVIAAVPLSTHRDVAQAMTAARAAIVPWSALSGARRAAVVDGALAHLAERIDRVAALACRDTGLPAQAARDDILSAIRETRAQVAGGGRPEDDSAPGVIGQILSWSSPLTLCIRTLAPDLAAGNTAVVHPSIQAPLSLVFLADALNRAGAPGGVFNLVQGSGTDAGMALARQPDLKRLDFQGSRETAAMAALSPERSGIPVHRHLRSIVHRSIDAGDALEPAVRAIADAAFCHAARAGYGGLVVDVAASRLDAFSEAIAVAFGAGRYAEGLRGSHTIAPFIAEKYRTAYEHLKKGRLAAGARPICTAPSPSERTYRMGWFARPCVLHDPTHRITLDPDRPNGPLVLVRSA
ncbi:MAG: aldehyde dehydrogenase family protein [Rhodospirillales bacterium]|nr:aldehyde dehydrogenase family protein [Rhodospirillales bacterium]MDE0380360.1 aldehyde dehydrogenase family protein [Rhodospirillales bacterium]